MKRLVLHIGLEKTGTTSFQAYCTEHRAALLKAGALYPANPACFLRDNHAPLAASYFSDAEAKALLIAGRRVDRSEAVSALRREIEAADAPLTLRTEWRSEHPPPDLDRIPALRDRLGVDLHPVDATQPAERRCLQALVWP